VRKKHRNEWFNLSSFPKEEQYVFLKAFFMKRSSLQKVGFGFWFFRLIKFKSNLCRGFLERLSHGIDTIEHQAPNLEVLCLQSIPFKESDWIAADNFIK